MVKYAYQWYNIIKAVLLKIKKELTDMKIGIKIRELRKKRGMTQEQLAEHLNISAQAVSKWENQTAYPDINPVSYTHLDVYKRQYVSCTHR